MALSTWYEVCVYAGGVQVDNSAIGTLDSAKSAISRFKTLYPQAELISVRQHMRNSGNRPYRVLHKLTHRGGQSKE